ncbi:FtsQ-type POTRA domain-containing protein [Paenibacillaceae bacterium]|nr:FtsQ-type POTRA domain-containing protein [Paenibacillaceae bacterium]
MLQSMPVLRGGGDAVKRKGSRRLLIVLFLLFVVLLAVLFFNSAISKISSINITGELFVTTDEVIAASSIQVGDAFFGASGKKIEERIAELAPVEKVTVTKKFPGEINIQVQEYPAVAFELSTDGEITAILESGTDITLTKRDFIVDKPVLSGWRSDETGKANISSVLAEIRPEVLSDFSEIIPIPSNSYPDRIKIYTRTRFEIITATSLLKEKVDKLEAVIETQEPGRVTMLLADTYKPFELELEESEDSNEKDSTQ